MLVPESAIFVEPLPSQVTGVDFLGLAAVNERLAALAFPGISNVTRYMRAYSVMSWMTWRFAKYFKEEANKKPISEKELALRFLQFREKIELLFTLGNPDRTQIAGQTRRDFLPDGRKSFSLRFSEFGNYKVSWLDAAVYGPSLGTENGLGFLERAPAQSYRPSDLGEELALALDQSLRKSPHYESLADIHQTNGTNEMIRDLGRRWAVRESNAKERACFRKAFFPEQAGKEGTSLPANRAAMIRLVLRTIRELRGRATVEAVRQTIARGVTRSGKALDLTDCLLTQGMWSVLQIRQLQRLAHEALLRWVEIMLLHSAPALKGRTPADLANLAADQVSEYLGIARSSPVQHVINRLNARKGEVDYYLAGLTNPNLDPFSTIDEIQSLRDLETDAACLPGAALNALALCSRQAEFLQTREHQARWIGLGGSGRLSLQTLVRIFSTYESERLDVFVHFLIEACVVGQHFAVTNAKLEPNKNKYRFISNDEGLRLLIKPSQLTGLNVTGDRLQNAMELMADCGLLDQDENGITFSLP